MTASTCARCWCRLMVVVVVCLLMDVVTVDAAARSAPSANVRSRYAQYDALFVARCEARCWRTQNKSSCVKACLLKGAKKPGQCPNNATVLSPFAAVCLEACQQDSQCPALNKCCQHSCGVTCQQPLELSSSVGVPDIPRDVRVSEGRRKRTIYIEWKPGGPTTTSDNNDALSVLYLIEERHHAGRNFNERRLSEWTSCGRTVQTTHWLRNFGKPGRWYQFRVAAVNENGTKGYSDNSLTFSVSISPKPPKAPQNVTVGHLWTRNNSLNTELRWTPPPSDLPIQRYKVFWSRRLHGATALDSVLVHQQVVGKDQTNFLLQDLQPNSLYFLQVQALVQFGKERLKGEKSGLVLNTTNYTNITDNSVTVDLSSKTRIEGLYLQKIFWSQGELRARVTWKSKKEPIKYTVSSWTGPCHQSYKNYSHFKFAATTKASHFDLHNLQFNCRYRVSVREVSTEGMKSMQDTSVTFMTPSCNQFKLSYKKVRCIH